MEDADAAVLRKLMVAVLGLSTVVVAFVAYTGIGAFVILSEPIRNPDLILPTLIRTLSAGFSQPRFSVPSSPRSRPFSCS
jgi:hypothetical protein